MMSGLSLALYNLFRFFAVDLHKDGNQSEDYQTQRPGRNRHDGEQALQHRPQLGLPLAVDIVVVVLQIALPCGVHAGRNFSE